MIDLVRVRKVNNYEDDATSGPFWTSTTTFKVVCPPGKRWFLIGGVINRNASGTAVIAVHDSADDIIHMIELQTAGTGRTAYPGNVPTSLSMNPTAVPIIIDPGEYLLITLGVAQDATAYASCVVLEVSV